MHINVIILYGIYYYRQCTLGLTSVAATDQPSPLRASHIIYVRDIVYGDYDRVRWSVSRLMGFWRGCPGDELNSPLCRRHGHP